MIKRLYQIGDRKGHPTGRKISVETYLGDGLFVSFDDDQFVLRSGNHSVALDPEALEAFFEYVGEQLTERLEELRVD